MPGSPRSGNGSPSMPERGRSSKAGGSAGGRRRCASAACGRRTCRWSATGRSPRRRRPSAATPSSRSRTRTRPSPSPSAGPREGSWRSARSRNSRAGIAERSGRDEGAKGAANELARERELVAVVAERRRSGEDTLGGVRTRGLVELAALESFLGRGDPPRDRGDAPEDDAHVSRHATLDAGRGGDGDEREAPRLAVHRLLVRTLPRERGFGDADLGDELARPERVLAPLAAMRRDEEVRE